MESMIEVKNVKKVFKSNTVLEDINLQLEKGKIYGFVGNNGSGKTMLMKIICGFIKPTQGEVFVSGKRIGVDIDFPESVGVIIETPTFIPYISGYGNLKNLADIKKKIGKEEIYEAMKLLGLDGKSKKRVSKYSLGMRQRLGIAQAIMENPDILILDEPMNGLDKNGMEEVRNILLAEKEAGKTILLASHNEADHSILCDEIFQMEEGRLVTS